MAWEDSKEAALEALDQRITARGDAAHRDNLQQLSAAFYGRFPAPDMRHRSTENLYGCLYGLLRFMDGWQGQAALPTIRPAISAARLPESS